MIDSKARWVLVTILLCLSGWWEASIADEPKPADSANKKIPPIDFSDETVGAVSKAFAPVVGQWRIGNDDDNLVLVVDGTQWSRGQTAAGIADRARELYGERYAEFLDNVKAFAYFPYAVATECEDFREGVISLRFKSIAGKIDQAAGILFNLKPNGDYLALRANPLENNLVLWKFERGKRSSVEWVKDTPTPFGEWHDLKLVVTGSTIEGYLNDRKLLTHELDSEVSGRVGIWTKADSVVYFDEYTIKPTPQ